MKKHKHKNEHSYYDFLISTGMDEMLAKEMIEHLAQKERRKKKFNKKGDYNGLQR